MFVVPGASGCAPIAFENLLHLIPQGFLDNRLMLAVVNIALKFDGLVKSPFLFLAPQYIVVPTTVISI